MVCDGDLEPLRDLELEVVHVSVVDRALRDVSKVPDRVKLLVRVSDGSEERVPLAVSLGRVPEYVPLIVAVREPSFGVNVIDGDKELDICSSDEDRDGVLELVMFSFVRDSVGDEVLLADL